MKAPHSFTRNRLVSHLRIAGAVTLLSAAAAMALVAVKPSGPLWAKSESKNAVNKLNQDRVQLFRNKLAMPGPERDAGPTAAAETMARLSRDLVGTEDATTVTIIPSVTVGPHVAGASFTVPLCPPRSIDTSIGPFDPAGMRHGCDGSLATVQKQLL